MAEKWEHILGEFWLGNKCIDDLDIIAEMVNTLASENAALRKQVAHLETEVETWQETQRQTGDIGEQVAAELDAEKQALTRRVAELETELRLAKMDADIYYTQKNTLYKLANEVQVELNDANALIEAITIDGTDTHTAPDASEPPAGTGLQHGVVCGICYHDFDDPCETHPHCQETGNPHASEPVCVVCGNAWDGVGEFCEICRPAQPLDSERYWVDTYYDSFHDCDMHMVRDREKRNAIASLSHSSIEMAKAVCADFNEQDAMFKAPATQNEADA